MKATFVLASVLGFGCRVSLALYSPDTERVSIAVSTLACQEAEFKQGQAIVQALQSQSLADAMAVLPDALTELRNTPELSPFYPARAFCVHELVPSAIVMRQLPTPPAVTRMRTLGLNYFYYEPDARWFVGPNPIDLMALATNYLDSRWGRQAFLMMTQLGWSVASCREGPDQFYTVIERGQAFLQRFPNSEVSNDVRLAVADAYATWWNLSQNPLSVELTPKHDYQKGATEAKSAAIKLYGEYLKGGDGEQTQTSDAKAGQQITLLQTSPKGSSSYEFFCSDYAD